MEGVEVLSMVLYFRERASGLPFLLSEWQLLARSQCNKSRIIVQTPYMGMSAETLCQVVQVLYKNTDVGALFQICQSVVFCSVCCTII